MATAPTRKAKAAVDVGRIPPQDIDAEMATLGSMMLDRQAVEAALPIIHRSESHWFYRPQNRALFELLLDLYDRNEPIDLIVVNNELRRRGQYEEVGGEEYIVACAENVSSWVNAEYYAKIVRDKGMLRDLIGCVGQIGESAYAQGEDAATIFDAAEEKMFAVTERRVSRQASALGDMVSVVYRQIESRVGEGGYLTGLPTGFHELDDLTSGLQRGDLIIVAGRPSMGKTALGLNIAEHLAVDNNKPVAFFSMEMSREQIALRILCGRGKVSSHRIRRGLVSEEAIRQLGWVCEQLAPAPLYIDDTPGMTALEVRSKARRFARQYEIQAVLVDYMQLMHSPMHQESRQQEIAAISRGLKGLARELNIPVIAMAQLNRAAESREGNRPRMSDLRESGAIEQDADVVLLLHREEYFKPEDQSVKGIAEVIIAKQRNGPTETIKLQFNRSLTQFNNLAISPTADSTVGYGGEAPF
ncbi:MAG TPA: replicative DNA helicase [Phycisphaerae bacterium]|nr:replicative DNA helicase [Phycisphaerae bacterium]